MGNERNIGISDTELLMIESDVLTKQALSTDIAETEAERFLNRASQARAKILFVEVRNGLSMTRPGLDLPYPESGEEFKDYYDRMIAMADKYDEEEGE